MTPSIVRYTLKIASPNFVATYTNSSQFNIAQTGTDTVIWTFRIATQDTGGSVVYPGYDAAVQKVAATLDNMASASGIIDTTGHTTYTDVLAQVKNGHGSSSENFQMHYGQLSVFRVG